MHLRKTFLLFGLVLMGSALIAVVASGQTEKRLSAREIFYSPPAASTPAKKEAPKQAAKAKEKKPAEIAQSKPSNTPAASGSTATSGITPPSGSTASASTGAISSPRKTNSTINVAYTTQESTPLGLRYSILKREGSESVEVDSDTVFQSGDRIRLRIDVNTSGYLYIVNRGSSGNWKPLFPSPEIAGGDNRVQKGTQYEIPSGYVFTFDEQPGKEKLFIVFSHKPVSDLEELIYSLTSGSQKPKESARPLLALATVDDGLVSRLRTFSSRDLIIEKVDETAKPAPSAPAKEKAVYVVNPSRDADARVVADVTLIHQ
jgi:hypothetical protein